MTRTGNLFDALRERRVFRSLGIYLALAWLLLQVAGLVADIWEAPDWVLRLVFLLLLAGVPLVAIGSWVYDLRGDGLVETRGVGFRELLRRPGERGRAVGLVAGLSLLVLLLLAYLWPDESLSADSRRVLANAVVRSDDPRSFLYGLYGLDAPADHDIWTYGRYRVTAANVLGHMPEHRDPPVHYTVDTGAVCFPFLPECVASIVGGAQGTRALIAANAVPLARYRELTTARAFGDVTNKDFDISLPSYRELMLGHRLELHAAILAHAEGDQDRAYALLAEAEAFPRRVLAASTMLVSKMVATRMVYDAVQVNVVLAARSAQRGTAPPPIPARLTAGELSLVEAMGFEASSLASALHDSERSTLWPYQPRRTTNRYVKQVLGVARISLRPAPEVQTFVRDFQVTQPAPSEWLFNTEGALYSLEVDFLQYLIRMHNLDATIVLARLARAAIAAHIRESDLPSWLLATPPDLRNPFDGKSATWRDGGLEFETLMTSKLQPVRVALQLAD